ncbi:uncharacterized protein LACBIDRAFT_329992 [Laccaria bicolor S238N-H82]|uniref:Predicted protein n=1 Tax=Laccaria bicolor (strain S238N-H82 / ATCC MYA-4686) TaxID=486041 RepID=B0DJV1_LACBS|nr:uncharacterized protein LACBIDRAFT_329992 [Laccaria bicolor S238N-H82]EDR05271.1 predicted protein [Laccaria bicolor S238N-H82]|eukprot:XP_001884236.1 predicted protein [Laccaria bicolor S238N-H82]
MWCDALRTFNPNWEVSWAPTIHGTDKQMWIRFPEIRDEQENMIMKITAHFEKLKTPVCSSFTMKTGAGGVILSLACHKHIESIMKLGRVDIPGVLHPLMPQRGRQIEIEDDFELAIMGLTDEIDSVKTILESWLIETFVVNGKSTLAGIRSSPDMSEALVFHMTTWQVATRVLSSTTAKLFNQTFGHKYPTLITPQSIYAINHKGLWRNKTIHKTFNKGSELMNESLKTLQQQINNLKLETWQGMQAMQMEMSTISSNLALLAQSTEIGLSWNLAEVQTVRLMLHPRLVMTNNPREQAEVENIITTMDSKESEIRTQLDGANHDFQTLIGVPPGQLLPPPPSSNSSATLNSGSSAPSTSSAPAAPPGLMCHAPNSAAHPAHKQPQCSSVKRQRTMSEPTEEQVVTANLMAEDGMVVEDTIPATEVSKIPPCQLSASIKCYVLSCIAGVTVWFVSYGQGSEPTLATTNFILYSLNGNGHRIIGAYAPWNPGGTGDVHHFWNDIAQLCLSSPTSWTMAGDFNATVSSLKRGDRRTVVSQATSVDVKLELVSVQSTIKAVHGDFMHQGSSEVGEGQVSNLSGIGRHSDQS